MYILTIGNVLNADTKGFKRADGFCLDSLSKVSDIKDVTNKMNLLVYISTLIKNEDENSGIEQIKKQFPGVAKMSKMMFSEVASDLSKMKVKVKQNNEVLKTLPNTLKSHSKFVKSYSDCTHDIEVIEKDLNDVLDKYQKTMLYYGYTTDDSKKPEEFFEMFDKFLTDVEKSTPKTELKKTFTGSNIKGARTTKGIEMEDVIKGIQQSRVHN